MTVHSENGWVAVADTSSLTRFTAVGQGWWAANADCAVVATRLLERFNSEVEPIAGPVLDDWSYANRLVRGSGSTVSNHGSATAWDVNALRHQRGVHATFTRAEVAAVRRILASITDDVGRLIFRWGEDYASAPVDAMHFEIHATPTQVKQAANKIRTQQARESEMDLPDKIKLSTQTQVNAMNANLGPADTKFKVGDTITVERSLLWGGPGAERLLSHMLRQEAQITALAKVVASAAAGDAARDAANAAVLKALAAGGGITAAQVQAAAEAGAKAALAELGAALTEGG